MTLGRLIERLKSEDSGRAVSKGFARPHSYRGYYDDLAFEPAENVTIGSMLEAAQSAVGATYEGWKGGEYIMSAYTDVYLANRGECGEELGEALLDAILGDQGARLAAAEAEVERLSKENGEYDRQVEGFMIIIHSVSEKADRQERHRKWALKKARQWYHRAISRGHIMIRFQAETARLRGENFQLSAGQCVHPENLRADEGCDTVYCRLRAQRDTLVDALYDMTCAYVNKDEGCPHDFEIRALKNAAKLLPDDKGNYARAALEEVGE